MVPDRAVSPAPRRAPQFWIALTIIPIANMIAGGSFQEAFFWYGLVQGLIIMLAPPARAPTAGETQPSTILVQSRRDYTLLEAVQTPVFYTLFVMFILTVTGGLMAVAQLGPMAQDLGVKDTNVNLYFFVLAALPFALLLDRIMNGISRPLFGWISDHIGRENTMCIAFLLEGLGITALATFGNLASASSAHGVLAQRGAYLFAPPRRCFL
jgi:Na+/melibiose symporter-like transporter